MYLNLTLSELFDSLVCFLFIHGYRSDTLVLIVFPNVLKHYFIRVVQLPLIRLSAFVDRNY